MGISSELVSAINFSGNLHPAKNIICGSKYDIAAAVPVLRYVRHAGEPDRYGIACSGNNGYLYGIDLVERDDPWSNAFIGNNIVSIGIKIIEIKGIDIPSNHWC
jgi:hypothetical protein